MPFEGTKILEFNQYQKSDKAPIIIYADSEFIIEKIDRCKNNPENWSTTKVSKHIPSGFSISTILQFISVENRYDVYRGKDCMKKFCEFLRENAMKIISIFWKSYYQKSCRNHIKMQKYIMFLSKNLK